MKFILKIVAFLALALSLSSCATLFGPKHHSVSVTSNPEKAEIFVNGERMGTTPASLQLDPQKTYTIEYRMKGHKPITKMLSGKVGVKWVVLDVIGGLIPVIVDAATGNWYEFDQEIVHTYLEKE